jgi:hypothetical protein
LGSQAVGQDSPRQAQGQSQAAHGSSPVRNEQRPEAILLKAIQANPECAPYRIRTAWRRGAVEISGRVGSSAVYNLVVQIAIYQGVPFRDNLIIDSDELIRVTSLKAQASAQAPQTSPASGQPTSIPNPPYPPSLMSPASQTASESDFPVVTYPQDWKRRVQERKDSTSSSSPKSRDRTEISAALTSNPSSKKSATAPRSIDLPPTKGRVQMSVDMAGVTGQRTVDSSEDQSSFPEVFVMLGAGVLAILGIGLVLYFLPSIVAGFRGHQNTGAIIALNLFLGWTFLGWVVALVWALTEVRSRERSHYHIAKYNDLF